MTNTLAYCDTELCGVFVGGSTLTVTKTLAYYDTEFITTVKSFIVQAPVCIILLEQSLQHGVFIKLLTKNVRTIMPQGMEALLKGKYQYS
jgi:hypothetical protein